MIDMWFDVAETLISAQRSYLKGALEMPGTLFGSLTERLINHTERLIGQTANERMPAPTAVND